MTKLDTGLIASLPASDPGSAAVWGSKRINPRPQSYLCLTCSGCPSNDDEVDNLFSLNLFLWRHFPVSFDRLLRVVGWFASSIFNFSVKHRLLGGQLD